MENILVIGIAGGSGKTTLLKNIIETFGPAITGGPQGRRGCQSLSQLR